VSKFPRIPIRANSNERIARAAAAANEIETGGQKGCKVAIVIKVTFWLEVGDLRQRTEPAPTVAGERTFE
jgi:hypothetical protein